MVQAVLSCAGCEPSLDAKMKLVKQELQADVDQRLTEFTKRVCNKILFAPWFVFFYRIMVMTV